MKRAHASRPLGALLAGLLTLGAATAQIGCAVGEQDLERWEQVAEGEGRLAAYLADPMRPFELRSKAALVLLRMGSLDHLMSVLQGVEPEQRAMLLPMYAHTITTVLTKMHTPAEKGGAASLAYFVLQHVDELEGSSRGEPRDKLLVDTVVDWALEELRKDKAARAPLRVKLPELLVAAVAVRPEQASVRLLNAMRAARDVSELLSTNALLQQAQSAEIRVGQAQHLLEFARKTYPQLDPRVADAMVANGNETLLRFLLDAARDPRVPVQTREQGLDAAERFLKDGALGGLFLLLQADDPANENVMRLRALDLVWDFGGAAYLGRALQALPPTGTWWPGSERFREHVDTFCDEKLQPAAAEVRPVLELLVDDPNWVTRVYAMRCVERLFPEEAATLLEALADDETALPGWQAEGATTIGAHVRTIGQEAD